MEAEFTEKDKLQAEVRKLRAEIKLLARPYLQQPTSWIALGTLALSLVANYMQHSESQSDSKLAQASAKEANAQRTTYQYDVDRLADKELQLQAAVKAKQIVLDEQGVQFADYTQKLHDLQEQISRVGATKESLAKIVDDLKRSTQQFERSSTETAQSLSTPISKTHDIGSARKLEEKGFALLIAGDFEGAQTAFAGSENANNGYHQSYEIARLLRQNRMRLVDPEVRKSVLQTISTRYSLYASDEQLKLLKALAK
jgi:hypothetical protein